MPARVWIVGALLLVLLRAAGAEEAWVRVGGVQVNGKVLGGVWYLKQSTHIMFPILDIVRALGMSGSYDAATHTITCGSRSFQSDTTFMLEGRPYDSWRVLSRMAPDLVYGIGAHNAEFKLNRGIAMPVANAPSPSALPTSFEKVVLTNQAAPGEDVDLARFLARGCYTIVYYFTDNHQQCRNWSIILKNLTAHANNIALRMIDVNRPGVNGIDLDSPCARAHDITTLPVLQVYDVTGNLMISGSDSVQWIVKKCEENGIPKQFLLDAGVIH